MREVSDGYTVQIENERKKNTQEEIYSSLKLNVDWRSCELRKLEAVTYARISIENA